MSKPQLSSPPSLLSPYRKVTSGSDIIGQRLTKFLFKTIVF